MKIWIVGWINLLCYASASVDPCTVYHELSEPWRSTTNVVSAGNDVNCDRLLTDGWYRFKDAEMPFNQCVPQYSCGTHIAIWINGTIPAAAEGAVVRTACGKVAGDCCGFKQEVAVKNCGTFLVYYLLGTQGCSYAYCAGDKHACTGDQYSATGFAPCEAAYPQLTQPPHFSNPLVSQDGFKFICMIPFPPDQTVATFDVMWLIDGMPVAGFPHQVVSGQQRLVYLEGKFFLDHMNHNASCRVRASFADNHTGTKGPWVESNRYWVGVKLSDKSVLLNETKTTDEIQLISTVPVTCDPSANQNCEVLYNVQVNSADNVFPSQCSVGLTPGQWNSTTNSAITTFTASLKPGYSRVNRSITDMTLSPAVVGLVTPPFTQPPKLNVTVTTTVTQPGANCRSTGDPHIKTFDNKKTIYNNYHVGQYLMTSRKGSTFRVEARTWKYRHVSMNCGIAMREGNDVIVIDMCYGPFGETVPKVEIKLKDMFSNKTDISKTRSGDSYVVKFPSGAVVKVYIKKKALDLHVFVPGDFIQQTEGLCGYFDGEPANDLTRKDGKVEPMTKQPYTFIDSWSIPQGQSMFERVHPVHERTGDYCYCTDPLATSCQKTPPEPAPIKTFCPGCVPVEPTATPELVTPQSTMTSPITTTAPHEAKTPSYIFPNTQPPQSPEPTVAPVTKQNATAICTTKLTQFQSARKCMSEVFNMDISDVMDMCVSDLELTGDPDMALSALQVVMEECGFHSLTSGSGTTASQTLVCPGACSGNGDCINGTCECAPGFTGESCSVDMRRPPEIDTVIGGSTCEKSTGECVSAAFFGDNMRAGDTQCHMRAITYDRHLVQQVSSDVTKTPAMFFSSLSSACMLPPDAASKSLTGYMVSLSNNGVSTSTEKAYIVYDGKCLQCSDTGHCTLKTGTCYIAGQCYIYGDYKQDKTGFCNPLYSPWNWGPMPVASSTLPPFDYSYTKSGTGCPCYYDAGSTECACCKNYGCPCPRDHKHVCFDCIDSSVCARAP